MIKLRRMRQMGHVACMQERRGVYKVLVEKREGKRALENPGVDGMIILIHIFRKWNWGAWTGLLWLRIGTGGGLL